MRKPLIVFLWGVAMVISLRKWYQLGNSGMPDPAVIGPFTYGYAILALASDFLGGAPVVLAVALTFSLLWQSQKYDASTDTPFGKLFTPGQGAPKTQAKKAAAGQKATAKSQTTYGGH